VIFEGVERRYGNTFALAGLSLEIAPSEIVCLLGRSGCGKTTLLRIAAGIDTPTAGRVMIGDREVAGPACFVPPENRSVGLMFQDFALFPHLTVLANVAFGLKALPRPEARRAATEALERVGLGHMADAYPHILSGGQQQRVALARAIVPSPAVMLMDEPFSGLDVQLREAMQDETLKLLRQTRATTIVVTHSPEEAMRIGSRIAVMRAGRLEQAGTAEQLYRNPASLFIARLFSEINEITCRVENGRVITPAGVLPAPGLPAGAPATLCIRERAITLARGKEGLAGRVLDARFLGDVVRLEIAVDGFERPLRMRVRESEGWTGNAEVSLAIDLDKALVFAAETTENVDLVTS
jgi:iron(III) transport system ATP-binding protein